MMTIWATDGTKLYTGWRGHIWTCTAGKPWRKSKALKATTATKTMQLAKHYLTTNRKALKAIVAA